jgi:hypothetical protein
MIDGADREGSAEAEICAMGIIDVRRPCVLAVLK